jgi:hypothetical protein
MKSTIALWTYRETGSSDRYAIESTVVGVGVQRVATVESLDSSVVNLMAAAPKMFLAIETLLNDPECPDHIANYLLPILLQARPKL